MECLTCEAKYHNVSVDIGTFPSIKTEGGYLSSPTVEEYQNDPRWPTKAICGYEFTDDDYRQVNDEEIYTGPDGREYTLDNPVPGMIYESWWLAPDWAGEEDGKSYICITPDGWIWQIDGPCSNCTRPEEPHHCWCRHGEAPNFTVDKVGNTCKAGAGSIQTPNWHGFLKNGILSENGATTLG